MADCESKPTIFIIFGRPGAGKTTVGNAVLPLLEARNIKLTQLDLDVCIPDWMKENFAKGIYPTHEQRVDFAKGACTYVDEQIAEKNLTNVMITFSFVNTDLREVFQEHFPDNLKWLLFNTNDALSAKRIAAREGHFYKQTEKKSDEWNFAPVKIDHTILNGEVSVNDNALIIADFIENSIKADRLVI